jgi:hypothetical protein
LSKFGLGYSSWFTFSVSQIISGYVETVIVVIQVFVFWVIDCIDRLGILIFILEVDSGPVCLSLGVAAGYVFLDSLLGFLLLVPLQFAEVAIFVVPVGVTSVVCASSPVEP